MTLVVRSNAPPNEVFDSLRNVVAEMDPRLPLFRCRTLNDNIAALLAQPRLNSVLVSAFAGIAMLLTAIGVYGVIAYSVTQRTHEIGIRLALGAQKPAIFRLVIGQGVRLIAWSVVGGTLGSFLAARLLGRIIYGGIGGAPLAILLVGCFLAVIVLAACWVPARRAASVDPLQAIGER
jgi:putative ABC transport system permease protein